MDNSQLSFGPFRFDENNECLFAVLKYLIAHKGVLVTKQQLLDGVWPNTYVSEAVLKDCIRQLRQALNDDAKTPQFIETLHRRGYRFVASLIGGKPGLDDTAARATIPYTQPPNVFFLTASAE